MQVITHTRYTEIQQAISDGHSVMIELSLGGCQCFEKAVKVISISKYKLTGNDIYVVVQRRSEQQQEKLLIDDLITITRISTSELELA